MEKDFNAMPEYQQFHSKNALVIDLDDALYPKRDFVLQVYYLFANFIEFTIFKPAANDLLAYMKGYYEANGEEGLFAQTARHFPEIAAYSENFERLHHQARLPLKLLLFPEVRNLIQQFGAEGKPVFILTSGDPAMQLNKIKQIDWQGLESRVKVYFEDELRFRGLEPVDYLLSEHGLAVEEVGFIGPGTSAG